MSQHKANSMAAFVCLCSFNLCNREMQTAEMDAAENSNGEPPQVNYRDTPPIIYFLVSAL